MAPLLSRTLIRIASSLPAARPLAIRRLSNQPESCSAAELSMADAESKAVERIEDAIHTMIVNRSKPDWLPFVPGASYWVPPRQPSYGIAQLVENLANVLTDEEYLSLVTLQGWPSSAFFIHNETL